LVTCWIIDSFPSKLTNSFSFLACWLLKFMKYSLAHTPRYACLAFQQPTCFYKPHVSTNHQIWEQAIFHDVPQHYKPCTLPYSTYHLPQLQYLPITIWLPKYLEIFDSIPISFLELF
jgi:hypothetical protein